MPVPPPRPRPRARRPPIADVPLIVPCPRCGRVLRTTVSFRALPAARRVVCGWCARPVVVRAPRS